MSEIYGWFTPDNQFVECPPYKHFSETTLREIGKWLPGYEKIMDHLDDLYQDCLERIDENEHPEWHIYEMAQSDAEGELIKKARKSSLIRIGTYQDEMHFEGHPKVLRSRYLDLVQFAESHNLKPIFTKV